MTRKQIKEPAVSYVNIAARQLPPIDEVAASLVDEPEAMFAQEPAHFSRGEWPKLRHEPTRGAVRERRSSGAD